MPPFTSEQFHAITRANPECVWDALTTTGVPLDYLHGMTADTDWQPGATVTLALAGHWRLTGEVLAAERPHRLSCTLDDPPGSPSAYLTWELHGTSDGTIIRLNVDEPRPLAGSTEDLESAWLPVLSGLVKHLERGAGFALRQDKVKRAGERPPAKALLRQAHVILQRTGLTPPPSSTRSPAQDPESKAQPRRYAHQRAPNPARNST